VVEEAFCISTNGKRIMGTQHPANIILYSGRIIKKTSVKKK